MASTTRGSADEGSGTTDESAVTRVSDDDERLTTLDGRGSEALVSLVLLDSERFTGKSGLIDLKVGILGDDAPVSRNDSTLSSCQRCSH